MDLPSIKRILTKELHQHNSEHSTFLKEKDMLKVLSRKSSTTPAVELPSPRSNSETHTDTNRELSTLLLLKDSILANLFTPAPKPHSPLETSFPSKPCLKEPSSRTSKVRPEIADSSLEPPVPQQSSLVTPRMERKLESDFRLDAEKLSQLLAEP